MKKHYTTFKILLVLGGATVYSCESRTYEEISPKPQTISLVKYTENIQPLLETNCYSCHSANGAASFYPLTSYNLAKNAIDNIIVRIEKPAGDPQKMPQGGALSQNSINLIKQWKSDGLIE